MNIFFGSTEACFVRRCLQCGVVLLAVFVFVLFAGAGNGYAASEDPVRSYNKQSKITTYNRPGAENGIWRKGHSARFYARCMNSGSWKAYADGICYPAGRDSCSCNSGCDTDWCYKSWGTRYARSGDLGISRINKCSGNICLSENTDSPGSGASPEITDDTGDPMLAIMPRGDGYIEFIKGLDGVKVNGIYWLNLRGGNKYLMIPTKGDDFGRFVSENPPAVKMQKACMPARFSPGCPSAPSCSCHCSPCPDPDLK